MVFGLGAFDLGLAYRVAAISFVNRTKFDTLGHGEQSPTNFRRTVFRTDAGGEPVRDWLKDLPVVERKTIGEDIKTVQFGWPLGMPLVAHLENGIWEVRTRLSHRIARVLFVLDGDVMV